MESKSDLPRECWSPSSQHPPSLTADPSASKRQDRIALAARYLRHLTAIGLMFSALVAFRRQMPPWDGAFQALLGMERTVERSSIAYGSAPVAEVVALTPSALLRTAFGDHSSLLPKVTVTPTPMIVHSGIGGLSSEETPFPEPTTEAITRTWIITYVVQPGDVVSSIAAKFNISEETLCAANGRLAYNPDYLRVGQVLFILPVSGVLHVVQKGDTLESIAKEYKAKVEDIVAFPGNGLREAPVLVEGQQLIIPNGKSPPKVRMVTVWSGPIPKGASKGTGSFVWPTTGVITQGFKPQHQAIDIAWTEGTKVVAADSGYVVQAAYHDGYGRFVVIDHGNGYRTLYAHLKVFFVEPGQSVAKGERIGSMGNTGHSTGPHLHFEIEKNGVKVNPQVYLP